MSTTFNLSKDEKQLNSKFLYYKIISQRKINILFQETTNSIEDILLRKLKEEVEGKCIPDGFVKPESIEILSFSNGECFKNLLLFTVSYTCLICKPVEGMKLHVKAENITKAGIRAKLYEDQFSPLDIFIARDHNINHPQYQNIQENTDFMIEVIGSRYELNDTTISVIAILADEKYLIDKPKLQIKSDDVLDLDEITVNTN